MCRTSMCLMKGELQLVIYKSAQKENKAKSFCSGVPMTTVSHPSSLLCLVWIQISTHINAYYTTKSKGMRTVMLMMIQIKKSQNSLHLSFKIGNFLNSGQSQWNMSFYLMQCKTWSFSVRQFWSLRFPVRSPNLACLARTILY